jgi:iron(III) transport system permease protein
MTRLNSNRTGAALPLACAALALSGIVVLVLFVLYMTFVPGLPTAPGFTLNHWKLIFSERLWVTVVPNTAIVGFGAILVSTFFALPLAWLLNRTTIAFRTTFVTLIAVIGIIPGFILAMGWILLLDERIGLINLTLSALLGVDSIPLSVKNSPFGIAWVVGVILTPAIFFLLAGPMRTLDPVLEEAAAVAGFTPWMTLLKVSLPLVWPGILGALIYTSMTAVSMFEVPALLGAASGRVPVLSAEIFYAVRPGGPLTASFAYGAAGVYGVLLALPSLAALYFYLRALARSERYRVITGKAYRPREFDLGKFRWAASAFVVVYLLLAAVLPICVLVWSSLLPILQLPSLEALAKISLRNYRGLLESVGGFAVIRNTAVVVVSVAFLVCFNSFMISWVVVRSRVRFRKWVDVLAMLPHAIPGLAFAFALAMIGILASVYFPALPLSGTLAVIVVAHIINRLPFGTRITNAALAQVHPELEESAQVCGSRHGTVMWRIVCPLVKPSLIYLILWTAMLSFQEVTMALFLSGPHNQVLSVAIWELWDGGSVGKASAAAVAMVAIMGALMYVLLKTNIRPTSDGLVGGRDPN